ncbi:hypothetical protein SpCBS45565_g06943 [Spizellomyces sp. 'palustris']|nr:hypothetical protein SpCBS45565_g06943 [Spizellomyces sp. 'palustris']
MDTAIRRRKTVTGTSAAASVPPKQSSRQTSWRSKIVLAALGITVAIAAYQYFTPRRVPTVRQRRAVTPIRRDGGTVGYTCDPTVCKLPNCFCPDRMPPGGLSVSNTPQFVLLTFDDAVNTITYPLSTAVTTSKNPNGCRMDATYYVSTMYTDYHLVQMLKAAGHEIAVHTMTHPGNAGLDEIDGCRKALKAFSGVDGMTGFRAPYLQYNMSTYQALQDLNIRYDCSNPADPRTAPWPFTYDNGFPYICETGDCDYTRKFPGLWEIPMYALVDQSTGMEYTVMDPPGTPAFLMQLLQYNFKLHWESTRTPMGLWLHPAWFLQDPDNDRVALLNSFIQWTRDYTNNQVWYITVEELVGWMQNPVGLDKIGTSPAVQCPEQAVGPVTKEACNGRDDNQNGQIDEGLTIRCNLGMYSSDTCFFCPVENPSPSNPVPASTNQTLPGAGCDNAPPSGGCIQGTWQNCKCQCIGGEAVSSNGFCPDATGACTIVKSYDYVNKMFLCPGQAIPSSTSGGIASTSKPASSTTPASSTPPSSTATSSGSSTKPTTTVPGSFEEGTKLPPGSVSGSLSGSGRLMINIPLMAVVALGWFMWL